MTRRLELLTVAALSAGFALVGAYSLGAPGQRMPEANRATRAEEPTPEIGISGDELRDALEREATQREMLAAEVELMRSVLQQLAAAQAEADASPGRDDVDETAETGKGPQRRSPGGMRFEEERLARLGVDEAEIAELRRRWDSAQLAKLELSDRAARGGFLMRPRHRKGTVQIDTDLRLDLGEDTYDKLLYATNQLNRAVVQQVIGGSAAAYAGLQAGDQLISYGGARVFKPADLRFATATGTRGEQILLVVERGGERISVVVPRGPLGVLLTAASSPPR